MRHLGTVAAALAAPLIGCAADPSAPPAAAADAAPAASAASAESSRMIRARFDCDDGRPVEMRFFPEQGVAVLVDDGRTDELQQQVSASGYRYAGARVAVLGKGQALRIEREGRAPVACRERDGG